MSSEPTKVVDTILASMYYTGTCIGIETLTFRTSLNIGHTSHVLSVPANFKCTDQYHAYRLVQKKAFFFFSSVIFVRARW